MFDFSYKLICDSEAVTIPNIALYVLMWLEGLNVVCFFFTKTVFPMYDIELSAAL
jgi:hypothetical protein